MISLLAWAAPYAHANDLYNRLTNVDEVQVGQDYILVSSDRSSMLTYTNKAFRNHRFRTSTGVSRKKQRP